MERMMIVDGCNLLFQMYYGMPGRIMGADGQPIHAVLGFLGALLKMLRMVSPTHLAVIFDGECSNERTSIDGDYKANRPDYAQMSDSPFSQLEDLYRVLDHLGICHWETTDCEADDQIASFALRYGREGEVVIVSQDSDFFQLITERVSVLRYRGKQSQRCDPAWLREKLGIRPAQYAAFKSLTGDKADNIPGVPRVGPKTAAALMNQFDDLDALLAGIDMIRKPSIRSSVRDSAERIRINHRLIRLDGTAPLKCEKEAMTLPRIDSTTLEILRDVGLLW